ncbi:hypothetical protein C1708_10060 [Streptomyces sp. DH-12]|uniref:type VII secretion system-associated protein n=1 Tax=unclassified Streptomyces TaxID=2593676 RepID=UPI000CCDDBFD|nr:type VII secretion system-associated protein [Streptomyces sp. DH-12]PNV32610.1 hypothetical protein C1708_10060 [Streptomyces sp. DH-12]
MAATVLDSEFLRKFITNHIDDFRIQLENILKDDPNAGPAISSLVSGMDVDTIDVSKPLRIGMMSGQDSVVDGDGLNTVVRGGAAEILRILQAQGVLFEDLEQALWETITELTKSQGKNLEGITADDFMDIFEDVDSDFDNPGATEQQK